MKAYLLSATGVIFLSVIVSLIIPEGKLNKTITFVMRLICILVLIQPVTGIFKISPTDSTNDFFDYVYVSGEYSKHQSKQLEILLKDEFEAETDCTVEVDYVEGQFKIKKVEVAVIAKQQDLVEKIYEYLNGLGYINISVYAKST